MTEADRQHVIDDATLASVGTVAYPKDGLGGAITTAQSHFDWHPEEGTRLVVPSSIPLGFHGSFVRKEG